MKLYLKNGKVVELDEVNTININNINYGVGKYYDPVFDDRKIIERQIHNLIIGRKSNTKVVIDYGFLNEFVTTTDNIIGVEV